MTAARSRLLQTRRQRGDHRCPRHGSRHLKWRAVPGSDGLEQLRCACDRVVAERRVCMRCDEPKGDAACAECTDHVCAGKGDRCCRHATTA